MTADQYCPAVGDFDDWDMPSAGDVDRMQKDAAVAALTSLKDELSELIYKNQYHDRHLIREDLEAVRTEILNVMRLLE